MGITNSLAIKLGEYGIRINSIHPYAVQSPMTDDAEPISNLLGQYPAYLPSFPPVPLKRRGSDGDQQQYLAPDRGIGGRRVAGLSLKDAQLSKDPSHAMVGGLDLGGS
ncbi:hypothetical protein A9W95_01400 [Mycobacterium sp. 1423905.2]|nr:hypothetical protein A9W95_01400 [Mycobacterium sp. 1423905.2]